VVTSDREVRNAVERFGAVALHTGQFSAMLHNQGRSFEDPQAEQYDRQGPKKGNPRRLSKKERKRREKLQKLKS
jgi:hypothetical protein